MPDLGFQEGERVERCQYLLRNWDNRRLFELGKAMLRTDDVDE